MLASRPVHKSDLKETCPTFLVDYKLKSGWDFPGTGEFGWKWEHRALLILPDCKISKSGWGGGWAPQRLFQYIYIYILIPKSWARFQVSFDPHVTAPMHVFILHTKIINMQELGVQAFGTALRTVGHQSVSWPRALRVHHAFSLRNIYTKRCRGGCRSSHPRDVVWKSRSGRTVSSSTPFLPFPRKAVKSMNFCRGTGMGANLKDLLLLSRVFATDLLRKLCPRVVFSDHGNRVLCHPVRLAGCPLRLEPH